MMLKFFLVVCMLVLWSFPTSGNSGNPMVHQEGARLIDENGQIHYLRGVNIENWLTWPGHCWGGEFVSEKQVREHLQAKVGAEATKIFKNEVSGRKTETLAYFTTYCHQPRSWCL